MPKKGGKYNLIFAQVEEETFIVHLATLCLHTKLENNLALSEIEDAHTLWPNNSIPR